MNRLLILLLIVLCLAGCEKYPECSRIDGYISEVCESSANLSLNSEGGKLKVAFEIAKMTQDTHIERYCFSSCVVISSRGDNRSMCHDAFIGLHQANVPAATKASLDFYYQDDRIDYEKVRDYIINTPNSSMKIVSATQALELGLIDEVLQCGN